MRRLRGSISGSGRAGRRQGEGLHKRRKQRRGDDAEERLELGAQHLVVGHQQGHAADDRLAQRPRVGGKERLQEAPRRRVRGQRVGRADVCGGQPVLVGAAKRSGACVHSVAEGLPPEQRLRRAVEGRLARLDELPALPTAARPKAATRAAATTSPAVRRVECVRLDRVAEGRTKCQMARQPEPVPAVTALLQALVRRPVRRVRQRRPRRRHILHGLVARRPQDLHDLY
eukprot:SAG11_NODE_47_length_20431_cov_7.472752_8_plen_229_part_00